MYNYRCDTCGAYLDPGETCDCREKRQEHDRMVADMLVAEQDGQMVLKEAVEDGMYTRI